MSKIDDLINALPEPLQAIARRYLPVFQNAAMAEVEQWIGLIAAGNWTQAYRYAVESMPTADNLVEQERLVAILIELNSENARIVDAQREVIREILLALLSLGLSSLAKLTQ
jgi:hypothetical protein